jgi:phage tail-like protein
VPRAVLTSFGERTIGQDRRTDPATKNLFFVDSHHLTGAFSKVSGIQEDIEVLTQRDGQNPQQVRKMPGTFGGGEIKLERGVVFELRDLVDWFSLVRTCGNQRRLPTGEIIVRTHNRIRATVDIIAITCDSTGENPIPREARLIRLKDAWPRRYQLADLDALASDVEVENITLAFEELEFGDPLPRVQTESFFQRAIRGFGDFVTRAFGG